MSSSPGYRVVAVSSSWKVLISVVIKIDKGRDESSHFCVVLTLILMTSSMNWRVWLCLGLMTYTWSLWSLSSYCCREWVAWCLMPSICNLHTWGETNMGHWFVTVKMLIVHFAQIPWYCLILGNTREIISSSSANNGPLCVGGGPTFVLGRH